MKKIIKTVVALLLVLCMLPISSMQTEAKMNEKKDNSNDSYSITVKIGKRNYHLCVSRKKVENALNVAFEADDR